MNFKKEDEAKDACADSFKLEFQIAARVFYIK